MSKKVPEIHTFLWLLSLLDQVTWQNFCNVITVWLNPGRPESISLCNVVERPFPKSHFLKINQSRHFAKPTYFSFIKLEGILGKQKVEHLSGCQEEDCFGRKVGMEPESSHILGLIRPGARPMRQKRRQLKEAEDLERKKRMEKKLRENRRGPHRWNRRVS